MAVKTNRALLHLVINAENNFCLHSRAHILFPHFIHNHSYHIHNLVILFAINNFLCNLCKDGLTNGAIITSFTMILNK